MSTADQPTTAACCCPDPLREVHPGCPLHGHSPEAYVEPASEREEAIGRIMRRTGKTRERRAIHSYPRQVG